MTTSVQAQPQDRSLDLAALRAAVAGEVVTRESAAYDEARKVHDITVDRYPQVIVRCTGPEDVAATVRFAAANGRPVSVRSGGHGLHLQTIVDGAIVADLSLMKGVSIDAEAGTARVQAGVNSGELAGPLHAYGLALTTGDTATVGLGGIIGGGGIGWMVRRFGLTIDHILSARVVTADGRILTASPEENADLFWAVRGGAGNFGIITDVELRLDRVGQVLAGAVVLPATREVIRGFVDYAPVAPEDLTMIAQLMLAPPAPFIPAEWVGKPVFLVMACWSGDVESGQSALEPIRRLAAPVADVVAPMPYPAIYELTAEAAAPHAGSIRSMFQDEISDEAIDAMLAALADAKAVINMVQLRGLGGAMARGVDSAFSHRSARYLTAVIAIWMDAAEDATPHRQWVQDLYSRIAHEGNGNYVNFLEVEGEERIREAYGDENFARLRDLKRKYDPANMFRHNQNIRP